MVGGVVLEENWGGELAAYQRDDGLVQVAWTRRSLSVEGYILTDIAMTSISSGGKTTPKHYHMPALKLSEVSYFSFAFDQHEDTMVRAIIEIFRREGPARRHFAVRHFIHLPTKERHGPAPSPCCPTSTSDLEIHNRWASVWATNTSTCLLPSRRVNVVVSNTNGVVGNTQRSLAPGVTDVPWHSAVKVSISPRRNQPERPVHRLGLITNAEVNHQRVVEHDRPRLPLRHRCHGRRYHPLFHYGVG